MSFIELDALAAELRSVMPLEPYMSGEQLIVTLPCSFDHLILSPGRSSKSPKIFWQQRTGIGATTGRSGFLEWPSESRPLVDFILHHAYSLDEFRPQYRSVLEALRGRGLDAQLNPSDGGGYLIHLPLRGDGYLLIAAAEILPPRLEQVTGWHVEHYVDDEFHTAVYDSMPENRVRGGFTSGPDVAAMADSVARYVGELLVRYGGTHPLGAPHPGETGPGTLAMLLVELAALESHFGQGQAGGALITIAASDGSDAATVSVPPAMVNRISAMVLAEITASQSSGR